ncbi:MAG: TlpA disulfide reductase family protein [Planctomycetota bacterium]
MPICRSICSLIVVTSIFLSSVVAEQKRAPTPYGILYNEWKAEVKALDEIAPALTTSDKRDKQRELNTKFTPRFLELAKTHLGDDLWIDCLIWTSVEGVPGAAFDEMFDVLRDNANKAENHFQLQLLMSEIIKLQSDRIDPALSAIAESHPQSGLRGAALFALAARTKRSAEEKGDVQLAANAEKLLERVITEYPKVSTYRGENLENATALLEDLRSPVAITKTIPSTKGTLITGEAFDLEETIRGKVAVVSFSGHWCAPCVAMHPIQKEIVSKFSKDAVVVVEINSDQLKRLPKVRERIEADGLPWTVVSDGSDGPISKQWHVAAWPTYFVIDSDGRIRRRASGNVGRRLITWVEELATKSE